jgi:hypothetical protein
MIDHWITAAERYAANSKKIKLKPEQIRPWISLSRALVIFHNSEEGFAARALLTASDTFISFGASEVAANIVQVMLSQEGEGVGHRQKMQRSIIGWGPKGPSEIISHPAFGPLLEPMMLTPSEFAKALVLQGKSEESTLEYLRSELNKVAAKAPAPVPPL